MLAMPDIILLSANLPDYPGPVLSKYDFAWALQSANGSLMPPRQHEFWIDPSSLGWQRII